MTIHPEFKSGWSRNVNMWKKVKNARKIILDVTCTPADIHYPTDILLLNKAREALEDIINTLHEPHVEICQTKNLS